MAAVTICSIWEHKKKTKSLTVSIVSPSISHEVMLVPSNVILLDSRDDDHNTEQFHHKDPSVLPSEKSVCRSGSELELGMEQQTCSKLGKEYVKAVYCHPAYLTYLQSTS